MQAVLKSILDLNAKHAYLLGGVLLGWVAVYQPQQLPVIMFKLTLFYVGCLAGYWLGRGLMWFMRLADGSEPSAWIYSRTAMTLGGGFCLCLGA